ncbi:MAG: phosphoribosylanthranilate isomerase [Pseudomonadota bacterium]|nr:phosphoribosylanthranilate isomerase [Pseudomonadota bacterium]MDE3037295.1 phosphoribosylanthranilate isomerase [Pseudomonadota bacterium]
MNVKVKICGLNDEAAVQAAIKAGADFAGFVFYPGSPRHIALKRAAELNALLPPRIKSASVLVDPDDALLAEVRSILKPDYVQLHGNETPRRLREIKKTFPNIKIIKAISVHGGDDVAQAGMFYDCADMLMFDAASFPAERSDALESCRPREGGDPVLPGGNGLAFDWVLLARRELPLPWFLSGGLTPENVADAIRISGAGMIDVSSGVERERGVKDASLIEAFIKAAKT